MTNYITLRALTDHVSMILCNNIVDVDEGIVDSMIDNYRNYDEDRWNIPEVYQYYLTDLTDDQAEYWLDHYQGIVLGYSEKLDVWVFGATSYGVSWEDVWIEKNE